ncbi:MAG: RNA polymerase sigma-70 factor [Cyclobacteriaceae bacterium]|nr:RNA polymerase sigma-70 factor [Cyclobacteriaceae bacterium]
MNKAKQDSLLLRIAQNERTAFDEFFDIYHSRLIKFALMFVPTFEDAEDVVSDVMIKILRQKSKLPQIENFSGYLFLAVKNQSLNLIRKNRGATKTTLEEIPIDQLSEQSLHPLNETLGKELAFIVSEVVKNLPPKRRQVFELVKNEHIKISEVGELMDISEKTVKKHLELAMRSLRIEVQHYYLEKSSSTPVIPIDKKTGLGKSTILALLFSFFGF